MTTRSAQVATPIHSFAVVSKANLDTSLGLKKAATTSLARAGSVKRKASDEEDDENSYGLKSDGSLRRVKSQRLLRPVEPELVQELPSVPPITPRKTVRIADAVSILQINHDLPSSTTLSVEPMSSPTKTTSAHNRLQGRRKKKKAVSRASPAKNASSPESTTTAKATVIEDYFHSHRVTATTEPSQPQQKRTPLPSLLAPPEIKHDLATVLKDLASLHRAFLRDLSIHVAHNGAQAPIRLHEVLPNLSRSWGKRQVTEDDIRRCLTLQESLSPFFMAHYGRNMTCLEVKPECSGRPLAEEPLIQKVEENLDAYYATKKEQCSVLELKSPAVLSLADIPLAPIQNHEANAVLSNPVLAKGQRELHALHDAIAQRQQEESQRKEALANAINEQGEKLSVLDRIRMKEAQRAQLPSGPSAQELARRAALLRVGDIAAVLSMLSLTRPVPRQAFPLKTIMTKLRDSLRTPMSLDETKMCVRLLADEVAPNWIQLVTVGGRENVVMQRAYEPVKRVIEEQIQARL